MVHRRDRASQLPHRGEPAGLDENRLRGGLVNLSTELTPATGQRLDFQEVGIRGGLQNAVKSTYISVV